MYHFTGVTWRQVSYSQVTKRQVPGCLEDTCRKHSGHVSADFLGSGFVGSERSYMQREGFGIVELTACMCAGDVWCGLRVDTCLDTCKNT
eukprot:1383287-Amorphochlora_amoeboformis.AAC.1